MRGVLVTGALCLVGCNSLVGSDPPTLATCFGSLVNVCLGAPPTGDLTISDTGLVDIDTRLDPRCTSVFQPDGPELCVMAGQTVTVAGMIYASGPRPLVLLGADEVTISGELDVSSFRGSSANFFGAGANADECVPPVNGSDGATDAGGGAGGSFALAGGDGAASQMGVAGGKAAPVAAPLGIRGGCKGGDGGLKGGATIHAAGGWSGGSVYIVAGHKITIMGAIYAAGEGGLGGVSGGGGGGTGGLVALDARTIDALGTICANGGGGGGGGDGTTAGRNGDGGERSMYMVAATGGAGVAPDAGGIGGDGGAVAKAATSGTTPATVGSGGGGGGAAGVIWVHGALTGTKLSPSPTRK